MFILKYTSGTWGQTFVTEIFEKIELFTILTTGKSNNDGKFYSPTLSHEQSLKFLKFQVTFREKS